MTRFSIDFERFWHDPVDVFASLWQDRNDMLLHLKFQFPLHLKISHWIIKMLPMFIYFQLLMPTSFLRYLSAASTVVNPLEQLHCPKASSKLSL